MGLTRVAISRPLFILMVILAMVIMGVVAYSRLGVELFPNINVPVVTVITSYPGAAPDDVERLVTKPIEDAVSGISNVDVLSSSSTEGRSTVTITFTDRANADLSATDVERRVSAIRASLPSDVRRRRSSSSTLPSRQSCRSRCPAIGRSTSSTSWPTTPSSRGWRRPTASARSTSPAASSARSRSRSTRPSCARYGLSLDQVQAALARENVSLPGGSIDRDQQQINVRLSGLFQSVDQLKNLIISQGPAGTSLCGCRQRRGYASSRSPPTAGSTAQKPSR